MPRKLEHVVVHHSASPLRTTLREIDKWHRARGFDGVGYNYVIEEDGRIQYGRTLFKPGAHTLGHNRDSVGICVVGNNLDPEQSWTEAQEESLKELVRALRMIFPGLSVAGHRDMMPEGYTECPGIDVRRLRG